MSREFPDWQRSSVYTAQGFFTPDLPALQIVETGGEEFNSCLESTLDAFTPRLFPKVLVSSRFSTHRAWARGLGLEMQFGPRTRPYVIVHEVAHLVTQAYPSHGVEWAQAMLSGSRKVFGDATADMMEERFRRFKVAVSYEDRDAYTRKRARWVAGKYDRAVILLKPAMAKTAGQVSVRGKVERLDQGLLLKAPHGVSALGSSADVLVPYEMIAYVKPD